MEWCRSLYRWLEETIFNTLNRKLVGNLLFVGLFLATPWVFFWTVRGDLLQAVESKAAIESLAPLLESYTPWAIGLTVVSFLALLFAYGFLRFLIVVPIRKMIRFFDNQQGEEADLSARLPVTSIDEYQVLAESYNASIGKLRSVINEIRSMGVGAAVEAARLTSAVESTSTSATSQGDLAESIFHSSHESTQAINQVADSAQSISASTTAHVEISQKSMQDLQGLTSDMEQVSQQLEEFTRTVSNLSQRSESISKVINLIQSIAFQTNLLALNAAVEAARAGSHGKGFAVVAEEVRNLAGQVNRATGDIAENISQMTTMVEKTEQGTQAIGAQVQKAREGMREAGDRFAGLVEDLERDNQQLMGMAAAVEQVSTANEDVHYKISEVRNLSTSVGQDMSSSASSARNLGRVTEKFQETLARFRVGEGPFEELLILAQGCQKEYAEVLERLMEDGVNIFDQTYSPIANTAPQKFHTCYHEAFTRTLQPLFDRDLSKFDNAAYCLLTDVNGYVPAHHRQFSQPPTGDPEFDLVHSRDRRLFNANETQVRRAQNRQPFLLQTYLPDTGRVLSDLSLPIHVGGRHWGALIIGLDPNTLAPSS